MEQRNREGTRTSRREEWRRVIEGQQACGKSVAAYCREHGLPVWKFSYWSKALRGGDASAEKGGFVELRSERRHSGVCVEAGRWKVRLETGFDAATLLRALEALSAS